MPAAARMGDSAQVDQDAHGCPACPHPGVGPIVEKAKEMAQKQAQAGSDSHETAAAKAQAGDAAADQEKKDKHGSIVAARWSLQRALNGQEVELQIECKDPKGSLKIEIWAQSFDRAQDKSVSKLDAQAAASVKKKVKLDIPADAAGTNECHFY